MTTSADLASASSSSLSAPLSNVASILLASLLVLVVTVFLVWLLDKFQERTVLPNPVLSRGVQIGHYWSPVTPVTGHPAYCNVCGDGPLLSSGAFCDSCGIWTDEGCIAIANKNIKCKELTKEHLPIQIGSYDWLKTASATSGGKSGAETHHHHHHHHDGAGDDAAAKAPRELPHNWKRGNLPLTAKCSICHDACGQDAGLSDWRCVWCARTVHDDCIAQASQNCDLGHFRHYIIPPFLICLKQLGMRSYRKTVITKSPSAGRHLSSLTSSSSEESLSSRGCHKTDLGTADGAGDSQQQQQQHQQKSVTTTVRNDRPWQPLIVIANRKSGGSDADAILSQFRSILNPVQVIDLASLTPLDGLRWCLLFPDVQYRILICGGDGTIGWVLRTADNLDLPTKPQFSILPLGTGNDLSRTLGWGGGFTAAELNVRRFLGDRLDKSTPVQFDRWMVNIRNDRKFGLRRNKQIVMNNYFSVGCDALVALNFHRKREQIPKAVSSRLLNKLLFFIYGTKDTFEKECRKLNEKVKLELDGREVELPELESVVVLNINSWGAGVPVWSLGGGDKTSDPPQISRYDDGILEVFGVYSSFHIAQLQVRLTEPIRLGRARHVRLTTRAPLPVQCDGEPWTQNACAIDVTFYNQVVMLRSPPPVERKRQETIDSSSEEEEDEEEDDANRV